MSEENNDLAFTLPKWSTGVETTHTSKQYTPFKYLKNKQQTTANPFAPSAGHACATPMTPMSTGSNGQPPLTKKTTKHKERKRASSAHITHPNLSRALLESIRTAHAGDRCLVLRRQLGVSDINAIFDSVTLNDCNLSPLKKTRHVQLASTRSERFKAAGIAVKITSPPPSPPPSSLSLPTAVRPALTLVISTSKLRGVAV